MLTGKLVVDILFVLIEVFFAIRLRCKSEYRYWLEIGAIEGGGSASVKFLDSRGRHPRTVFAWIDTAMNALGLQPCRW